MLEFIEQELAALKQANLYRSLKTIEKIEGSKIVIDGKELVNFCSNDYLGLSQHPKVKERAIEAIKEFGTGSRASRLVCGNTILHEQLEKKIAQFKGRESAIVFPTGYMANVGTITSLVGENDTIIIDRLNHASIIDACRLAKAKLQVYGHRDIVTLEAILKRSAKFAKRLIVTDSLFSMDGDIAPLPDIIKLAKEYNAITMIDEAHSTGTLGKNGRGAEEHFNTEEQTDIVMGTLSKAIGSLGGFVAGSKPLIDYLRNKARSFIYTTALPPASCAASLAAFEIIESDDSFLASLKHNEKLLKADTPIIPIITHDAERTITIARQLFERGLFVSGIRPPTVPEGESRLRITVTAQHSKEEIECLVSSLRQLIPA
ncbi:MAG: 8-amino-7-oxononanoate synthase [Candidatus Margulisiibacteriota bacterium]